MASICATPCCVWRKRTYRPQWSAGVLEELERNLVEEAGLASEAVQRRIGAMQRAFPGAEVRGYEALIESMTCDAKDQHVLAAAVRGQSEVLVTFNGDDFPEHSTAPYDIEVISTDDFLLDQLDLYPGVTMAVLRRQASDYVAPPMTVEQLLGALAIAGVPKFAAEVQRHQPQHGD